MRAISRRVLVPGLVLAISACGGPKKEETPPPEAPATQPAPEAPAAPESAAKIPWSVDLAGDSP